MGFKTLQSEKSIRKIRFVLWQQLAYRNPRLMNYRMFHYRWPDGDWLYDMNIFFLLLVLAEL